MKELSLADKNLLKKHLENQTKSFRLLVWPFLILVVLAYFAFRQHWLADTFPAYLALLALVVLVMLVSFLAEIIQVRKAIKCNSKAIITGIITKKSITSDENYSGLYFEVGGKKYEVEDDQFEAFNEGDRVKLEFSTKGKELIAIKPVKHNSRWQTAYRKAKISARKFRR